MAYAFISYQTSERHIAAKVPDALAQANIPSFMAHEHLQVSDEWRNKILEEILRCDIFVCLLSQAYLNSTWCVQESGIAAFRGTMTIVPLSIDGTIPPGFIGNVQASKINPESVSFSDILPGIAKHDLSLAFHHMLYGVARARSYRGAEEHFKTIAPYTNKLTSEQAVQLLRASIQNGQVLHASLCATQYLPPLANSYGHLLEHEEREKLMTVLLNYAS